LAVDRLLASLGAAASRAAGLVASATDLADIDAVVLFGLLGAAVEAVAAEHGVTAGVVRSAEAVRGHAAALGVASAHELAALVGLAESRAARLGEAARLAVGAARRVEGVATPTDAIERRKAVVRARTLAAGFDAAVVAGALAAHLTRLLTARRVGTASDATPLVFTHTAAARGRLGPDVGADLAHWAATADELTGLYADAHIDAQVAAALTTPRTGLSEAATPAQVGTAAGVVVAGVVAAIAVDETGAPFGLADTRRYA